MSRIRLIATGRATFNSRSFIEWTGLGEAFLKAVVKTGERYAAVIHLLPSETTKLAVVEEALRQLLSEQKIQGWCPASKGYPSLNVQPAPKAWSDREYYPDSSSEPGYLIMYYVPEFVLDHRRFQRPRIMRIGHRYDDLLNSRSEQ